ERLLREHEQVIGGERQLVALNVGDGREQAVGDVRGVVAVAVPRLAVAIPRLAVAVPRVAVAVAVSVPRLAVAIPRLAVAVSGSRGLGAAGLVVDWRRVIARSDQSKGEDDGASATHGPLRRRTGSQIHAGRAGIVSVIWAAWPPAWPSSPTPARTPDRPVAARGSWCGSRSPARA